MSRKTDDDLDMGDVYRAMREQARGRRAERCDIGTDDILGLRKRGWQVREITPFQFRINDVLDLYPTNRRWHHLKTNRRGGYGRETIDNLLARLLRDHLATQ